VSAEGVDDGAVLAKAAESWDDWPTTKWPGVFIPNMSTAGVDRKWRRISSESGYVSHDRELTKCDVQDQSDRKAHDIERGTEEPGRRPGDESKKSLSLFQN
jgi:hypothetical protein